MVADRTGPVLVAFDGTGKWDAPTEAVAIFVFFWLAFAVFAVRGLWRDRQRRRRE